MSVLSWYSFFSVLCGERVLGLMLVRCFFSVEGVGGVNNFSCGEVFLWCVVVLLGCMFFFNCVSVWCVLVIIGLGRLVSVVICRLKLWLVGLFFIVCMNISCLLYLIVFRCMLVMLVYLLVSLVSLK